MPARKPANKKKARLSIKKLRVALPVGVLDNNEDVTLAHGALVKGMVGSKHEERVKFLEAARQVGGTSRAWARAIGSMINALQPADEPLFSYGRCADDDMDLMCTGKGEARHAAKVVAALDRLCAPENAAAAAAEGVLMQ